MISIFKIIGIIGVILICIGIIRRKRKTEDEFYIGGGICLTIYSISIKDPIFIVLQVIFTGTAIYDYFKQ